MRGRWSDLFRAVLMRESLNRNRQIEFAIPALVDFEISFWRFFGAISIWQFRNHIFFFVLGAPALFLLGKKNYKYILASEGAKSFIRRIGERSFISLKKYPEHSPATTAQHKIYKYFWRAELVRQNVHNYTMIWWEQACSHQNQCVLLDLIHSFWNSQNTPQS